jgi:hypothetical protein
VTITLETHHSLVEWARSGASGSLAMQNPGASITRCATLTSMQRVALLT